MTTARSIEEWIGATPDTHAPPRVLLRVFIAFDGRCQCGCTRKIRQGERWQTDHITALINGGENRESNLQPLLVEHHKNKTKADVAEKSRSYHKQARNAGIRKPRTIRAWRKFSGEIVYATRERN